MLIAGLIGTTSALLLIGLVSMLLPEGTLRGYLVLPFTVTFLAFQQGAIVTGHVADAVRDLPAESPRHGHGRLRLSCCGS